MKVKSQGKSENFIIHQHCKRNSKMTISQPAAHPKTIRRRRNNHSGIDHSSLLDREIDQLRDHLQESTLPPGRSPTLLEAAAILCNISYSLLDLTQLLHTYQVLQSAGEPVATYLEQALTAVALDLQEKEPPQPIPHVNCEIISTFKHEDHEEKPKQYI